MKGGGGGIRCINMNGSPFNGLYSTSMATNASTSAVSGCAGDEPVRENDRFVCI